jgi:ketosteroid isomerase-like protein
VLSGLWTTALAQDTVRASIEASNKKFEQAVSHGDAAGIASTYTESAKLLPANDHVVSGRNAITQY